MVGWSGQRPELPKPFAARPLSARESTGWTCPVRTGMGII